MTFLSFINFLTLLATVAAVLVFFAIQVNPSLRSSHLTRLNQVPAY